MLGAITQRTRGLRGLAHTSSGDTSKDLYGFRRPTEQSPQVVRLSASALRYVNRTNFYLDTEGNCHCMARRMYGSVVTALYCLWLLDGNVVQYSQWDIIHAFHLWARSFLVYVKSVSERHHCHGQWSECLKVVRVWYMNTVLIRISALVSQTVVIVYKV